LLLLGYQIDLDSIVENVWVQIGDLFSLANEGQLHCSGGLCCGAPANHHYRASGAGILFQLSA
jgi:hypothetical protein